LADAEEVHAQPIGHIALDERDLAGNPAIGEVNPIALARSRGANRVLPHGEDHRGLDHAREKIAAAANLAAALDHAPDGTEEHPRGVGDWPRRVTLRCGIVAAGAHGRDRDRLAELRIDFAVDLLGKRAPIDHDMQPRLRAGSSVQTGSGYRYSLQFGLAAKAPMPWSSEAMLWPATTTIAVVVAPEP
jgi:hypothetical protein